jgi:hypothetical protein
MSMHPEPPVGKALLLVLASSDYESACCEFLGVGPHRPPPLSGHWRVFALVLLVWAQSEPAKKDWLELGIIPHIETIAFSLTFPFLSFGAGAGSSSGSLGGGRAACFLRFEDSVM